VGPTDGKDVVDKRNVLTLPGIELQLLAEFVPHRKHCVFITTTNRLIPFREKIDFYCENDMLKQVVHRVTTVLVNVLP
jgi:hypothetical protein